MKTKLFAFLICLSLLSCTKEDTEQELSKQNVIGKTFYQENRFGQEWISIIEENGRTELFVHSSYDSEDTYFQLRKINEEQEIYEVVNSHYIVKVIRTKNEIIALDYKDRDSQYTNLFYLY